MSVSYGVKILRTNPQTKLANLHAVTMKLVGKKKKKVSATIIILSNDRGMRSRNKGKAERSNTVNGKREVCFI